MPSSVPKARPATRPIPCACWIQKNAHELAILTDAPTLDAYLTEEERAHHEAVSAISTDAGVDYEADPFLVRGFDYYTKTAFEIQSPDLGAQNALGGGGRYNKLVEEIGGPPNSGYRLWAGRRAGLDRLAGP